MYLLVDNVYIDKKLLNLKLNCDYNKCRGACCWGEGLGTPLTGKDIKRIEKNTRILNYFEYQKGPRLVCRKNGECIFFKKNMCKINDCKPDYCNLFPVLHERKQGFNYLLYHTYKECSFIDTDIYYLERIKKILIEKFGKSFYSKLKGMLGNVYM
ncbi:MAG: DUF3109 family protein [Candidatus Muiribacteriota bacterium]